MQVCLLGASPDTGNLGVAALCLATLGGLAERAPDARVTVFDEGTGVRVGRLLAGDRVFSYHRVGAHYSRRVYRPESYWNLRVSCWFGGLGNPGAAAFRQADALLDLTGGDSFTDLYGPKRLAEALSLKRLALAHGVPLLLLPQTYGPFAGTRARRQAREIVVRARMAWARDPRSFAALRDLLGEAFDPTRHRCGVDVAFALPAQRPPAGPPEDYRRWLAAAPGEVAGINISGLLFHDAAGAAQRYGLRADYRAVLVRLILRLLKESSARVVLVPHVVPPCRDYESDVTACAAVTQAVLAQDSGARERLRTMPRVYDPGEAKWYIAQHSWLCATRMHAAIAALSSGVPTAGLAYSPKMQGVFETCGSGASMVDPRADGTDAVLAQLWCAWERRDAARRALEPARAEVQERAREQMEEIVRVCRALAGCPVEMESVA